MILLIPVVGIIILALWIAMMYNGLVRAVNHVKDSWAGIDVELKRRYDLIPNLVATVKGYAAHEKEVLESVIQARASACASQGSPGTQARDENALIGGLRRLFAVVEQYPALKASRHFLELQQELTQTEDRIQRARRFYNGNVRDLNNRIEVFPSNIIAGLFSFQRAEYFEIDDASRAVPDVE